MSKPPKVWVGVDRASTPDKTAITSVRHVTMPPLIPDVIETTMVAALEQRRQALYKEMDFMVFKTQYLDTMVAHSLLDGTRKGLRHSPESVRERLIHGQQQGIVKLFHKCHRDLPYDAPPHGTDTSPEIREALFWGPGGEWTGLVVPPGFLRPSGRTIDLGERLSLRALRCVVNCRFWSRAHNRHAPYHPYDPNAMSGRHEDVVASFDRYEDWRAWAEFVNPEGDYYIGPSDSEEARSVGVFASVKPHERFLADWLAGLRNGGYAFGYGALRDFDDRFDALGVLAEVNDADWREGDDGYEIEGDGLNLSPALVRRYLGLEDVSEKTIEAFLDLVTAQSDGATSHRATADWLETSFKRAGRLHEDYQTLLSQSHKGMTYEASLGDIEPMIRQRRIGGQWLDDYL